MIDAGRAAHGGLVKFGDIRRQRRHPFDEAIARGIGRCGGLGQRVGQRHGLDAHAKEIGQIARVVGAGVEAGRMLAHQPDGRLVENAPRPPHTRQTARLSPPRRRRRAGRGDNRTARRAASARGRPG